LALTPGARLGPYEVSTSNGVKVPASGENAGDDAFLAMEMVEGRPLSEVIPRGGMKR
jgi:hypothetical protein